MTLFTLSIPEQFFNQISEYFNDLNGKEGAGYLFCSTSKTTNEEKLIVREYILVEQEDIESNSNNFISIKSKSYVSAIIQADKKKMSVVLIHNHPNGRDKYSSQDNREEYEFFRTANIRAEGRHHGSLIFSKNQGNYNLIGRVCLSDKNMVSFKKIRVVGKQLSIHIQNTGKLIVPSWADRQVRAFGSKDIQKIIKKMHIGVVGVGGTGSAICEQLIRLGIGTITVVDGQTIEDTNVSRLYGSRLSDIGKPKVSVIKRLADDIGFGTTINTIQDFIYSKDAAMALRDCDFIFCCTDDHQGRSILNRMSIWYLIPVIDMAVTIDADKTGKIKDITGKITILSPGNTCLWCREALSSQKIQAEVMSRCNPTEYKLRRKENYVEELDEHDPAIIMLTTAVASQSILEFVHMITGILGVDRTSTEIRLLFDNTEIRSNSRPGKPDCDCQNSDKWGRGDEVRFLGLNW